MNSVTYLKAVPSWWRNWHSLPQLSWIIAAKHFKDGNYVEAEAHYLSGLKATSNHPAADAARLDLSFCYFRNGNSEAALSLLLNLRKRRGDLMEVNLRLIRLMIWLGKYPECLKVISSQLGCESMVTESVTQMLIAYKIFATLELQREVFELEVDAVSRKGEINKDLNLAVQRVITEIKPLFQDSNLNKTSVTPLLRAAWALLHARAGRREFAKQLYHELLLLSEPPVEAIVGLSELLIEDGQFTESITYLRRGLKMSPNNPKILALLGESYLGLHLRKSTFQSFTDDDLLNNEDYGLFAYELALAAAKATNWCSIRELEVLETISQYRGDFDSALSFHDQINALRLKRFSQPGGDCQIDVATATLAHAV